MQNSPYGFHTPRSQASDDDNQNYQIDYNSVYTPLKDNLEPPTAKADSKVQVRERLAQESYTPDRNKGCMASPDNSSVSSSTPHSCDEKEPRNAPIYEKGGAKCMWL